jgi:hypothetical protein
MYPGVPTIARVNRVSAVSGCEVVLATPKSMIRGTGFPPTSGLVVTHVESP